MTSTSWRSDFEISSHKTGEIAIERDVCLSIGVDEGVQLAFEHHVTYDEALPPVQEDELIFDEFLCGVG